MSEHPGTLDTIANADHLGSSPVDAPRKLNGVLTGRDGAAERLSPQCRDNELLNAMAADDLAQLQPHLKKFSMIAGTVLHAQGQAIEHVYFPVSGLISLLTVMRTGKQIETAMIGRDGVVGASIGGTTMSSQVSPRPLRKAANTCAYDVGRAASGTPRGRGD